MRKLILLLPYYWMRLRSSSMIGSVSLLADAYFMKYVDFPPRRFLLLFPEKLLKYQVPVPTGGLIVNPSQRAEDIVRVIHETYRELRTYEFLDFGKKMLRSRLNVVLPPRTPQVSWDESEIRGALMIYNKVFGESCENMEVQEYKLIHLEVGITAREYPGMRELRIKAPKPIPKIYGFLYREDRGFREALSSILTSAPP